MSFARAISLVFASLAFRRPIRVCLRCFPCRLVSPSCGALVLAGSACVAASCALPVGQGRAVGVHGCVGGQFCRCGQAARADPARLVWVNGLFMRSACTVAQAASSAGAAKLVASFYPLSSDSLKTSRNATFSPCPSLGRFEGSDISKRMKRAAPSPSLLRLGKKDIAPPHPPPSSSRYRRASHHRIGVFPAPSARVSSRSVSSAEEPYLCFNREALIVQGGIAVELP